jgi:Lon protease-like protein
MTDYLPLLPLKMVVFPNEDLNLHIFEPKYKQLIRECEENGITFGIPAFIDNKIMNFGTEISLVGIEKRHPKGELDIKTRGVGIFKIQEYYSVTPQKLYSGADVERIQINFTGDPDVTNLIQENLEELFQALNINSKISDAKEQYITYNFAHHVGFSIEQEYEFLCLSTELERQHYMLAHLKRLIPVIREMERLRLRAQLNGHFKNIIPPEV